MIDKNFVLWFCGLSGSGKTTLAKMLFDYFRESKQPVEHLDGDFIRDLLNVREFTREAREAHLKRIAHTSSLLEKHGVTVITSFISPYDESRKWARSQCRNFIEIYLSTSLADCEERDVKWLYKKARNGEIQNFTGIDSVFEPPKYPELVIDTKNQTPKESFEIILKYIFNRDNSQRPL